MPRKTITFEKEVYEAIQKERARLLMSGIEKNFTEMVNILCKDALAEIKSAVHLLEGAKDEG